MPSSKNAQERTPREKETLMFSSPEAAAAWKEDLAEHLREMPPGIDRAREVVGEAVRSEFEAAGEAVDVVRQPWEHSGVEHAEVQQLVDMAFAEDLAAALKAAKKSKHYPRNIDLFHDVLTGELYEYVKHHKANKQPLTLWLVEVAAVILMALLGVVALLFFIT